MHPDLDRFLELERVDREIARLKQEVASLPAKVAVIEKKLAGSKAKAEGARNLVKDGDSQKRKLEGEIQAQQQKISKFREQSLDVKTNDQYKALLHEITFAEKAIRGAEDKILELMVGAEGYDKVIKQAEADLKAETAEIEKEKAEARAVTAADEKLLAEQNGRRDALRSAIDESTLRHYDRVLKLRGSAVAEARDQKCMACQVMIRPQTYNDIRSKEHVIMCDSCQRILIYAGEALLAQAPAPAPVAVEEETAETPAAQ